MIKPEIEFRASSFSFSTHSVVLGFKVINHKSFQSMLYVIILPVRTSKFTPIFAILQVSLLFPHIIFTSVLSSLNDCYLSFFIFRLFCLFPPLFCWADLSCIKPCHLDCLMYVPERAAGSGNWSQPRVFSMCLGLGHCPLWDYPPASHLSSHPGH